MKKVIIIFAVILGSIVSPLYSGTQADITRKILPYPILQKKLANGLRVVTVPYNSPGVVSFYIIMQVGSRDEVEEGKTGFAHFFEHMMFRGTEKYSKEKYSSELKSIGASANANTWLDRTVYHMTGDVSKIDKMMELEADRFMNLKYSLQDFKTEAGAVKGEYTKNSSNPLVRLDERINDVAFEKHTYKHTTMGFFKDVVDMPNQYDYSISFFKKFYRPEYATILVVGDITAETVNALSEKHFGSWQPGNYKSEIPVEPVQTQTRQTHLEVADFPPHFNLSFKAPAYSDGSKAAAALEVLSSILFSEKSNLYNKLVIEEQKTRYIRGSAMNTKDPYLFQIDVSLKSATDMQYVYDEIFAEIEKIKAGQVDAKLLTETKQRLRYGFAMGMDNPGAISEALSYFIWVTGEPESLNAFYTNVEKLTVSDLSETAKLFLDKKGLTIATISPEKSVNLK